MNLQKEFKEETGQSAYDLVYLKHKEYYVEWLEEQVEQLRIGSVSDRFDSKYTPPFRVGRKQSKAVLDATGREVIFFSDSEEQAKKYCDYLNGC